MYFRSFSFDGKPSIYAIMGTIFEILTQQHINLLIQMFAVQGIDYSPPLTTKDTCMYIGSTGLQSSAYPNPRNFH